MESSHAENMMLRNNCGVSFLTFPSFSAFPFINHAFSTRVGGVSQAEFSSMNLSFGRGDAEENVMKNYRLFCNAAGFPFDSLTASAQDHHTVVRRVTKEDRGVGIYKPKDRASVDGLLTNEPGVTLVTYYADCVPLYFLDPVRRAIGLAHAGWRGTVAGMGQKMVEAMQREFGSDPRDLIAAVGPSIGPCCYEVDSPVADAFAAHPEWQPETLLKDCEAGKYMLDLWEANRRILCSAGVLPEHITVAKLCTRCHADWLYSHRASGGKRGGLAAFLCLKEDTICRT
ncbi:peptidoglycan editing factor PgeF [Anaeromassilibacillus senegalensis]|uniref:peptidoglycan editing factor PgeF n=1 Tax=Anaeromassilibacillus senegalensis TaxID=1673717 RepID=UPI00068213BB|nr:peptidoglycan editing factor PgeF [Anaeromassilibacillus senegalensis]